MIDSLRPTDWATVVVRLWRELGLGLGTNPQARHELDLGLRRGWRQEPNAELKLGSGAEREWSWSRTPS